MMDNAHRDAVKAILTAAYDQYYDRLDAHEDGSLPSDDELIDTSKTAHDAIIHRVIALPSEEQLQALSQALAVTLRVSMQMFNIALRVQAEGAERHRRISPN